MRHHIRIRCLCERGQHYHNRTAYVFPGQRHSGRGGGVYVYPVGVTSSIDGSINKAETFVKTGRIITGYATTR